MDSRTRRAAILFLTVLICVAALVCGCGQTDAAKKSSPLYPASEADLAFEKGAEQPPSLKTLYTMADILVTQGRDDQAEVVLTRIIREHPRFSPAYNSLAEVKMRHRRVDEAVKILSKGLEAAPSDPVLLNNLGMCWMIKRQYEKALGAFTESAGVNPQNTRYRANMAVALGFLGRDEEALALYRQILPENQARHNLEIIRAAGKTRPADTSPSVKDLNRR
ncbi:MAG: tetratricopeptide repeat protein [Planctomycetota bacterium]